MRRLFLVLIAASAVHAQEFRGTILGRVVDASGAVVPGASVKAVNTETRSVAEASSNRDGNYQLPFLLPGNYTVEVEHAGFRRVERSGVRVSVGTAVTVDFALEVGSTKDAVTVTAEAPLLNTAGADIGQVVEKTYVDRITVNTRRNPMNMVQLAPGIATDQREMSYTDNSQSEIAISGGGGKKGGVEFLVDGQPATVPVGGGLLTFVPSIDAVEEFKVHTTLFDASLGRSNGGAVSVTTRGGANDLHGATYLYKEWGALNANTWENNRLGLPKPAVSRDVMGVTASGPVHLPKLYRGRNRTFFSTSYERENRPSTNTKQARMPTDLERQGDFSQTIRRDGRGPLEIFDPLTTVVSGSTATRQLFPGARIPASRFDPTGAAVMKLFPAPNQNVSSRIGQQNWAAGGLAPVNQRQFMARLDHNFGSSNRLFGRFGRLTRDQNNIHPTNTPAGWQADGHNRRYFTSVTLDDTVTLSPTFVASFRYGVSRRLEFVRNGDGEGRDPADLKVPGIIVANQASKSYPVFNLGESLMSVGGYSSKVANDLHTLAAVFTKLHGNHSLKFGVDFRNIFYNQASPGSNASGNFTYNPTFTQQNPFDTRSADVSGTSMASLLLGLPASGNFGANSALSLQNSYLALYLQEDWKLSRRLTLNFGMRYERETPYKEKYDRVGVGFDPDAVLPVTVPGLQLRGAVRIAGVNGAPSRQGTVDGNNFGPRFGFAYTLGRNTVVRGGYGLFYSAIAYNMGFLGGLGVFNAVTPYRGTIDNGATPFTTFSNPFPAGLTAPLGASAGLMAQVGDALSFTNPDRVAPYTQQWQFSLQRELPLRTVVEAAYVGSLSLKQLESFNLNERPDSYLALGAAENTQVTNPFLGIFRPTSVLGQGARMNQSRLWSAFPQFTTLTMEGVNGARATYHAFQTKVEKRLTHGWNILWNYSFAKTLEYSMSSIVNERHYRTVSDIDQTHIMRLAVVYTAPVRPFGGGRARLLNHAVGGWTASSFYVYASGFPMGVTHAYGRPLRLRNASLSTPQSERLGTHRDAAGNVLNPYFDTRAFQPLPSQYTVTPEPPLFPELRGPGQNRVTLSVFKAFPVRERLKLEARMEAMDATNSPQYDPPATNMSNAATFGVVTTSRGARKMMGALRLIF